MSSCHWLAKADQSQDGLSLNILIKTLSLISPPLVPEERLKKREKEKEKKKICEASVKFRKL